jgi:hypothetical protein
MLFLEIAIVLWYEIKGTTNFAVANIKKEIYFPNTVIPRSVIMFIFFK